MSRNLGAIQSAFSISFPSGGSSGGSAAITEDPKLENPRAVASKKNKTKRVGMIEGSLLELNQIRVEVTEIYVKLKLFNINVRMNFF